MGVGEALFSVAVGTACKHEDEKVSLLYKTVYGCVSDDESINNFCA